ncbi:MAG: SIS domain-containing protein [Candidatus Brocadiaceae bacterium]|nr:SIS domain-containing protein [Candidatus Brocadiaceae bacterium]
MNNVEQMFDENNDIQQFSKNYFRYLFKLLNDVDVTAIAAFAMEMEKARKGHNTVFFIGNGGSAATASHMANDFGMDILKKTGGDLPFRAMALTDNAAVMLAIANDEGYDRLFVNQLRIHYRPGDKLVAISASGNSPNVVAAAEWVKDRGGKVISLVGFDGGKLKDISDIIIHAKSEKGEYGPVEDVHMIMDHLITNWLQYKMLSEQDGVRKI